MGDQRADDDPVPDVVRAVLVGAAADVLGLLEPSEVPASLRAVARFAPRKRAAAGGAPLWVALQDPAFRAKVARAWHKEHDDSAVGVHAAAGAWLRGDDWRGLVPADEPEDALSKGLAARLERTTDELARARVERDAAASDAARARDELAGLQRELRRLRSDADRARAQGRQARVEAEAVREAARTDREQAEQERATASAELLAVRRERDEVRTQARVARRLADARVRLLLDTVVDAAAGLRSELALAPLGERPADLVAPEQPVETVRAGSRGRSVEDPALLDELLRQPWAHLVVDGYNVTKSGFGALALDEQRRRLVDGLAVVAGRTGAEVTCCFDGRETSRPPGGYARGVRVRFSVGEIADDLIRRIVRAEPPGRVVVVVTSDRAVADDVAHDGAWVVPSATLVARLNLV
ncbi:NYN domain-containing protein [Cellulomonas sp. HZM]|uniref:NYN domain-containing protein n=1 Tax=Cellulomonas sp. HZM TaxID=1454010 RepID=UPI00068F0529|nr:NYN domain-containing protein [Cellulomonas sp. HZM]